MKPATHTVYRPRGLTDFAPAAIGPLALVNRHHPLQPGYTLSLLPPDERFPDILMERRAATLLSACLLAAGAAGKIVPVSGWRSRKEQQAIWDSTLAEEGEDFTRSYVAFPGCSEHETGLAIDLAAAAPQIDPIRPLLPWDGVCGVFRRLAPRYGFILRYPAHKTAVTGIAEEPWHFRYVGVPHAGYMARHDLCLEEYHDRLDQEPLALRLSNGCAVTVRRLPETAPLPPAAGPRQISRDNRGGLIVTDWEVAL